MLKLDIPQFSQLTFQEILNQIENKFISLSQKIEILLENKDLMMQERMVQEERFQEV